MTRSLSKTTRVSSRRIWRIPAVAILAAVVGAVTPASAIVINNPSFESPATSTATSPITDWSSTGTTGVFNNSAGYGSLITNADGNQLAYINANLGEIWQDLALTYQAGQTYKFTIGLAARSDNPTAAAATMDVRLAYRDSGAIIMDRSPVAYGAQSNSALRYFTVTRTVAPGDPSIGKPVVLWLKANGNLGDVGDWTADNVRVDVVQGIPVPNFSFETPDLGGSNAGSGFGTGTWNVVGVAGKAGCFKNNGSYGNFMNNADGDGVGDVQMAYLNVAPGNEIWQDLTSVYEVARAYDLTVAVGARSGQSVGTGTTLALDLYYRDTGGNVHVIAETIVDHATLSNTALSDFTVHLPSVMGGDAWTGKNIGIWIRSLTSSGAGDWTLDNVRLTTTVPEPGTFTLLAMAGAAAFGFVSVRRRRERHVAGSER
jgi:hypothetical protein